MPVKKIGSPHPKYLAATDILISDMSNISYDFLLYNRPIILIANDWVVKNFPDIGIKTGLEGLEAAIKESIDHPERFERQRKYWHRKTMHKPDGKSSQRVLDMIMEKSGYHRPFMLLIHGDNEVSKIHLKPLYAVIKERGMPGDFCSRFCSGKISDIGELICISTHNDLLNSIKEGFKVHIDHSVKGKGVTDFDRLAELYREKGYYSGTDLQVTEGEISFENTKKIMGPYADRVIMAGYPKSDILISSNTIENKKDICSRLGFKEDRPLITYAPTGRYREPFKMGASLSEEVLQRIKAIAARNDYNMLIKLRSREPAVNIIKDRLKKILKR